MAHEQKQTTRAEVSAHLSPTIDFSNQEFRFAMWQPNDERRRIFVVCHCVFYDTMVSTPFLCLSQCFPHSSLTQIPGGNVATKQ